MTSEVKMVTFTTDRSDFNRKFYDLYTQKSMVDVVLSAGGQFLYVHKLVLAVCSSFFEELFENLPSEKHPVVVMKDVSLPLLHNIVEYIYLGHTNILQDDVTSFKSAMDALRISLDDEEEIDEEPEEESKANEEQFEPDEEMKPEPDWENVVIKEEPQERTTITEETKLGSLKSPIKLPSSIQLKPSTTPRISSFGSLVTEPSPSNSSPVIRIRTPASINEKVHVNEQFVKTLKLVPRLPTVPTAQNQNPNIQELSKRLSKAILIRRVKKSDGSFVSERSPIKIVQGMKIQKIGGASNSGMTMKINSRPMMGNEKRVMPIFRCTHCSKDFIVNKSRNAHEKFCFKNPSRPSSECPFCPMVLCNPMYLSTHVRKVHGVDENGKSIEAESLDI